MGVDQAVAKEHLRALMRKSGVAVTPVLLFTTTGTELVTQSGRGPHATEIGFVVQFRGGPTSATIVTAGQRDELSDGVTARPRRERGGRGAGTDLRWIAEYRELGGGGTRHGETTGSSPHPSQTFSSSTRPAGHFNQGPVALYFADEGILRAALVPELL